MATYNNLTSLFKAIADSIRNKKGTSAIINAQDFPSEIDDIVLTSGNATVGDVLSGKTFSNDDGAQTGTMANNGAVSKSLGFGENYTIPQGYHNGSGKVSAKAPSGSVSITSNGTHNVTNYSNANVNVPNPTLKTETQSQTYQLGGGAGFVSRTYTFSTLTKAIGIYNFDDNSGSYGGLGDNKPIISFSGNTMTMQCSSGSGSSFSVSYKVTVIGW